VKEKPGKVKSGEEGVTGRGYQGKRRSRKGYQGNREAREHSIKERGINGRVDICSRDQR